MGDRGELLLRERRRRNLFWIDKNIIRLFWYWADSLSGKCFEQAVHSFYRRSGIAPLFPTLIRELQISAISPTIDRARFDIWESVATETFGQLVGSSFIILARDLCRFQYDGVPSAPDIEDSFYNRFFLNLLIGDLHWRLGNAASLPENANADHVLRAEKIRDKNYIVFCQTKGINSSQLELAEPGSVFDVTELLCQLFYTWIAAVEGFRMITYMQAVVAEFCCRNDEEASMSGLDLEKELELAGKQRALPCLNLALTFVLNMNSPAHTKVISSSGLQQLEIWLGSRVNRLIQGEDVVFSEPTAKLPAALIRKLVTEIHAAGSQMLHAQTLPAFRTGSCYDLVAKVDLHSSVLELSTETADMARILAFWFRCRGGEFMHRRMVQQINEAYRRMGWPPCRNSSLLHEIRSTLANHQLPEEQARGRYEIWLRAVPRGIRRLKCGKSFINFLAAVSSEGALHLDEERSCDWELVEKARLEAVLGGYHLLNPLLALAEEDEGVNVLALYLVEELRYWKRFDVLGHLRDYGDQSFDVEVSPNTKADFPPIVRLPDATRKVAERRLEKSSIVLCRDLTEPVLRVVYAWEWSNPSVVVDSGSKAWESLLYCLYLHGRNLRIMAKAIELDFQKCLRSSDPAKVALVTGECEVGPLVSKLLEELISKQYLEK